MRRAQPDFLSHPPTATSEWLTTTEVAALLRVHPKHVYRLLHQGMPARRVGGQWRFSRESINQWADRRGESLCADAASPQVASGSPVTSLVAIEPNELSDAFATAMGNTNPATVAMVHTNSRRAIDLLASGEVVAAVVRRDDALRAACATIRIGLGARQLGLLTATGSGSSAKPGSIALSPNTGFTPNEVASLLRSKRRALVHHVDSELEACGCLMRGEADAAIGSHAWARRLGLQFRALRTEPWDLAIRADAMDQPNVSRMCIAARGEPMREAMAKALVDREAILAGDASDRSRNRVHWAVLVRDRAQQMMDLVQVLRDRGLRVGGFVQVPSGPSSSKPLGYDLYRLSHPERIALAERTLDGEHLPSGERFCELTFHPAALARACEWLREDGAVSDLLIVDGVGRLEARGQGLFPALAWARTQDSPKLMILSSRREHVPEVAQRLSLSDPPIPSLSFGSDGAAPAHVINHILRACGRTRRRGTQGTGRESTR